MSQDSQKNVQSSQTNNQQSNNPQQPIQRAEENQSNNISKEEDQIDLDKLTQQQAEPIDQKFTQDNRQQAQQQKKIGNQKYAEKTYHEALQYYKKALQFSDNQNQEQKKFKAIIYSNIGLTYMKMQLESVATTYFQKALKLNQNYLKARTNLAICLEKQEKIQEALEHYEKVYKQTPNDAFIKQKVGVLGVKVKQIQEKRKEEVISGLKNIGNSVLGYFGMSLDNFKLQKGPGGGYNVSFKQ